MRPRPWLAVSRRLGWLGAPVDNSPLVLFRMLFGCLLVCASAGAIATGWVRETCIEPPFTWPHVGFEWLTPLPGASMYGYYAVRAVGAGLVMIGMDFKLALGLCTLLWTLTYLRHTLHDKKHYYLRILLCGLLLCTPAQG